MKLHILNDRILETYNILLYYEISLNLIWSNKFIAEKTQLEILETILELHTCILRFILGKCDNISLMTHHLNNDEANNLYKDQRST